jgi:uncharacterized protein with FMN-binding domain
VRKGTKSFVSILSLGLVAAGYQAGQTAEISSGFSAAAAPIASGSAGQAAATPVATAAAQASAAATSTAPAAGTVTTAAHSPAAAAPKATTAAKATTSTKSTTSTQAAPAAPAPAAASPAAPAAPAAADATKTGSAINYRYGTVQVSVTKANGKITAVNLLQAGATGGRQGAFSYLVQYAIQANGTSFGNLGGATFTTDAFKQSLESALAKF